MQPGEVKGFARRGADDAVLLRLFAERSENGVRMAGEGEVCVDFVGDHHHAAAQADFIDRFQFLPRPHAAYGIMRAAQEKNLHVVFDDSALHVLRRFHAVYAVFLVQRAVDQNASAFPQSARERRIDRLLDQNRVAFLRQGVDRRREAVDHARRADQPFLLRFPAETLLKPAADRSKIFLACVGIAENAVVSQPVKRLAHAVRRAEIHIRHPQRNRVGGSSCTGDPVVFFTHGMVSVDDFVKAAAHKLPSSFFMRPFPRIRPRFAVFCGETGRKAEPVLTIP